jgi:hypothetical protein
MVLNRMTLTLISRAKVSSFEDDIKALSSKNRNFGEMKEIKELKGISLISVVVKMMGSTALNRGQPLAND